jgi:S-formylglutathione hydrolase FrmB
VLLNGGAHSFYHDRRDGRWGSMMLEEAIPDAVRRFGTLHHRTAIGGISMGGYGALFLAGTNPRRFCAVGGHSAALWRTGAETSPGAFDDAQDFARHDVQQLARRGAYAGMPVWLDVGSRDGFRPADLAFAKLLRTRGVNVRASVWPGGHEQSYWDAHMRAYLRFYVNALANCGFD